MAEIVAVIAAVKHRLVTNTGLEMGMRCPRHVGGKAIISLGRTWCWVFLAVFLFPGFFVLRQTVAAATHAVNRGSNNLGSVKDPPFILNSTGFFGFTEILALGFKIHAFLAVSIDCTSSNIEANDDHLVIVSGCG